MKLLTPFTVGIGSITFMEYIERISIFEWTKFAGQTAIGIMTIIYLYYKIKTIKNQKHENSI